MAPCHEDEEGLGKKKPFLKTIPSWLTLPLLIRLHSLFILFIDTLPEFSRGVSVYDMA